MEIFLILNQMALNYLHLLTVIIIISPFRFDNFSIKKLEATRLVTRFLFDT